MMCRSASLGLITAMACSGATKEVAVESEAPPARADAPTGDEKTRKESVVEELSGMSIADPFRWLEDEKADEVRSWMKTKDASARAHLSALPERGPLASRLKELIYVEARGAPVERKGRLFYWKKGKDQEKAVHFVKIAGEEQVLLDPNTMSKDGSISVADVVPSLDGKLVAYSVKVNNADESDIRIMDVDTRQDIDVLPALRYTIPSWTPDNRGFFYTWIPNDPSIPENERMGYGEVRYHVVRRTAPSGESAPPPAPDEIFREKLGDPTRWQGAYVSEDGKYLFLSIAHGWSEEDIYVMFLNEKKRAWRPLAVGTKALYSVEAYDDVFYIATNRDAPRWRVYSAKPAKLDQWKEIIREDPTGVIDDFGIIGGKIAIHYLRNASSQLSLYHLDGKPLRSIALPAIGTSSGLIGNQRSDTAYFTFSSFTYPMEIYETSIRGGKTSLFAKVEVPLDPSAFETKQVFVTSKDGTKVSMFIVHEKGIALDGNNPTLLYGYGGFNISLTPSFAAAIMPWIERGGVYAVPNLRGGGEYGEAWHKAGMGASKQNVFDDFIAAAEHLIAEKYTRRERLAISGRSNGGLLVGAAMTQRPELFAAVLCGVPLLDMIRYPLVGVGKAWVPEYGDPTVKEEFLTLYGYSPYHRVKDGASYPALLMLSADSDDRVDPMHARKFHAAIEHASSSGEPNLLRIEMNSGHGGGDLRKAYLEQTVDELSFLLAETR
jgi:prolyl oligopeptidase